MFNMKPVAVNSGRTYFIYLSENSTLHQLHNSEFSWALFKYLIDQEFCYEYLQKFQY